MKLKRNQILIIASAAAFVLIAGGGYLAGSLSSSKSHGLKPPDVVQVRKVVNGHFARVDDTSELIYAGIRAPYSGEPFFEQSKKRNEQLVEGKAISLKYDKKPRDTDGRLLAYAYDGDTFVNLTLLREGLAYAKLERDEKLHASDFLDAQNQARREKKGLWSAAPPAAESSYIGDTRHATFHRASCKSAKELKPEREATFKSRDEAFDRGYAPCRHCLP